MNNNDKLFVFDAIQDTDRLINSVKSQMNALAWICVRRVNGMGTRSKCE